MLPQQKMNETDRLLSDIFGYFADHGVLMTKFDLKKFANYIGTNIDTATTFLCNLEEGPVMNDIANGNFDSFDKWDRTQFNDSYADMMDAMYPDDEDEEEEDEEEDPTFNRIFGTRY